MSKWCPGPWPWYIKWSKSACECQEISIGHILGIFNTESKCSVSWDRLLWNGFKACEQKIDFGRFTMKFAKCQSTLIGISWLVYKILRCGLNYQLRLKFTRERVGPSYWRSRRPKPQGQILSQILDMLKIPYKMFVDDIHRFECLTGVHIIDFQAANTIA